MLIAKNSSRKGSVIFFIHFNWCIFICCEFFQRETLSSWDSFSMILTPKIWYERFQRMRFCKVAFFSCNTLFLKQFFQQLKICKKIHVQRVSSLYRYKSIYHFNDVSIMVCVIVYRLRLLTIYKNLFSNIQNIEIVLNFFNNI